jgi:hypothetical protein
VHPGHVLGIGIIAAVAVVLPPVDVPADYQLGGAYPPPAGVGVVARDWREQPAAGAYGICYINGFQTQPEQRRWWLRRHPGLVLRRDGEPVADPDWPGEMLLDTRTAAQRRAIAQVVGRWISTCERAGFQAVEADNLDSWTRSLGLLRRDDNRALARLLSARSHRLGLASAQKNAAALTGARFFDFAVVEECQRYDECGRFLRRYDDHVLEVEYRRADFTAACRDHGDRIAVVLRDRALAPAEAPGHRFATC